MTRAAVWLCTVWQVWEGEWWVALLAPLLLGAQLLLLWSDFIVLCVWMWAHIHLTF